MKENLIKTLLVGSIICIIFLSYNLWKEKQINKDKFIYSFKAKNLTGFYFVQEGIIESIRFSSDSLFYIRMAYDTCNYISERDTFIYTLQSKK